MVREGRLVGFWSDGGRERGREGGGTARGRRRGRGEEGGPIKRTWWSKNEKDDDESALPLPLFPRRCSCCWNEFSPSLLPPSIGRDRRPSSSSPSLRSSSSSPGRDDDDKEVEEEEGGGWE